MQVLINDCWLHISAPEIAACLKHNLNVVMNYLTLTLIMTFFSQRWTFVLATCDDLDLRGQKPKIMWQHLLCFQTNIRIQAQSQTQEDFTAVICSRELSWCSSTVSFQFASLTIIATLYWKDALSLLQLVITRTYSRRDRGGGQKNKCYWRRVD